MRSFPYSVLLILALLASLPAVAQTPAPPPSPANFDPSAPAPKNLPAKMNVPADTRIEVTAWTKGVNPSLPADTKNLSLLWSPHLLSAVIESDKQNSHAVFQWEGGRSSEAFLINGLCFRLTCLAYPQLVSVTSTGLDFWISRQNPTEGDSGTFPGASWYRPSSFAGTASLNGSKVLAFSPVARKTGAEQPSADTVYPDGPSLCLDPITLLPVWLNDGTSIYSFTYIPAHGVQINPQGFYLKAIVAKFGHYP
jgi:hypothetical protein